MDYSKMSDHEINAAVGEVFGWNAKFIHQDNSVTFRDDLGRLRGRKNYCNSWADAGPIIENFGIGLKRQSNGMWVATQLGGAYPQYSKSPLRAAMIVYLMMHDKGEE